MSQFSRATVAPVRSFGRRRPYAAAMESAPASSSRLGEDVKLFAMTFLGGLLFMTVYLA